jgi:hypothetical protein
MGGFHVAGRVRECLAPAFVHDAAKGLRGVSAFQHLSVSGDFCAAAA